MVFDPHVDDLWKSILTVMVPGARYSVSELTSEINKFSEHLISASRVQDNVKFLCTSGRISLIGSRYRRCC